MSWCHLQMNAMQIYYTYQCIHQFSPFVLLPLAECNSSCRLCLGMHQLQVIIVQHRHAQMSMHCVMDVIHLHHMPELMHRLQVTIQQLHVVRTLHTNVRNKKSKKLFITRIKKCLNVILKWIHFRFNSKQLGSFMFILVLFHFFIILQWLIFDSH